MHFALAEVNAMCLYSLQRKNDSAFFGTRRSNGANVLDEIDLRWLRSATAHDAISKYTVMLCAQTAQPRLCIDWNIFKDWGYVSSIGKLGLLHLTRASHPGRSFGSRVTWSKIGNSLKNSPIGIATKTVTMATGTITMGPWVVTLGEAKMPEPPALVLNAILSHNVGLYPQGRGSHLKFARLYKNINKFFTNWISVIDIFWWSVIFFY